MERRMQGFTALELAITLAIVSVLLSFMIVSISEPFYRAKISGGISEAQSIVSMCNIVRVSPISTARDSQSLKVYATYIGRYDEWTDVSVLKNHLPSTFQVPTANPFGKSYYFKLNEDSCKVALETDLVLDEWEGYEIEDSGGRSRIIISTPKRSTSGHVWVKQQSRMLSGEDFR